MTRSLLAAAALACALAGCANYREISGSSPLPPERPAVTTTSKVAAAVRTACDYRVAATTILAVVETYRGQAITGSDLAADVARGICASVQESYASNAAPTFRGVAIRGDAR